MIRVEVKADGMRELRDRLAAMDANVTKEVRIAYWKAQKRIRSLIAGLISKNVINQPKKVCQKAVYSKMRDDGFVVVIRGEFSIAIKRFKPKQNKQGVTAKTGKKVVKQDPRTGKKDTLNNGKEFYKSAFMGPRPGVQSTKLKGAVVQRVGKARMPIKAVSAVNVVLSLKNVEGTIEKLMALSKDEAVKQVRERIRFLTVKKQGKLNWQNRG
jgi:hypothetical protein